MAADDGFHEIQLNGKQLVFIFMATTVVAVVIFLGGVMVGRGVLAGQAARAGAEPPIPVAGDLLAGETNTPPAEAGQAGSSAAARADDLSYYNRLGKDATPPETLNPPPDLPPAELTPPPAAMPPPSTPPAARPAEPPPAGNPPAARASVPEPGAPVASKPAEGAAPPPASGAKPAVEAPGAPAAGIPGPPPGSGFVVQVAAVEDRAEADAIAARLLAKKYAAFVAPPEGTVKLFRVRVGTFKTRREADAVARRLQKEEGFQPWITR